MTSSDSESNLDSIEYWDAMKELDHQLNTVLSWA
jgi:hypothetical protein